MKNKRKLDYERLEELKKIRISEDYNFTRDSVGKKANSNNNFFCCS